jgi:type IV secretory pathway TraG/TraD family ATPase VirD4
MPGQRLDPPLLMALDEVTQICPVPLPQWLADAGGQGVQIWSAFHGLSQLEARWQPAGAQAVMDTSNVKVLMPGLDDTRTLERARTLAGRAAFVEHGEDRHSRHDVLTEDMIRMLPAGWALLLRGNHKPVIARLAKGWRDREYRRAKRTRTAVARLTPLPHTHAPLRLLRGGRPADWPHQPPTGEDPGADPGQAYPWDGGDAA